MDKKDVLVLKQVSQEIAEEDEQVKEMLQNAMVWGYDAGKAMILNRIKQVYDNGRFKYLPNNKYLYVDREGNKKTYRIKSLVKKYIKVGGWELSMAILGITENDVKEIIEQYDNDKMDSLILNDVKGLGYESKEILA